MTLEYFKENICKYCKKKCNEIKVIKEETSTNILKCVDYEKDETKIQGYVRPLERTAKIGSCVMPNLISDWSKY